MYCMTACSTHNEGSTSLSMARLRMIRHEGHALTRIREADELIFTLISCQQCENPVCAAVCPAGAITRDSSAGAMVIEREACTGCCECVMKCPFGAISLSENDNGQAHAFKCELCGGDPQCVKFCSAQALTYAAAGKVTDRKTAETAQKGPYRMLRYAGPRTAKTPVPTDRGKKR